MLLKRFNRVSRGFDELRRFLKSKDASVKLHEQGEVETLDLGSMLRF